MRNKKYKKSKNLFFYRTVIITVLLVTAFLVVIGVMGAVNSTNKIIENSSTPAQSRAEVKISESSIIKNSSVTSHESSSAQIQKSSAVPKTSSRSEVVIDENYFDDAVFIGNSRTEGLRNYDGLEGATYFAVKGLMVNTTFTKPAIKLNGRKVTVMQALKGKKYGKVYIMLGVNELGWSSFEVFIKDYGKVIEQIKKDDPNSQIFVQSILPVSKKKSVSDKIYNNKKINYYNKQIKAMTEKKGIKYLEVNKAVSDKEGNLPEDASVDGVHLNRAYCKKWCDYLKKHTY